MVAVIEFGVSGLPSRRRGRALRCRGRATARRAAGLRAALPGPSAALPGLSAALAGQQNRVAVAQRGRARRDHAIRLGQAAGDLRAHLVLQADRRRRGTRPSCRPRRSTYTPRLPSTSTTALRGTTSAFCRWATVRRTRAYMPGLQAVVRVRHLDLHRRGAGGRVEDRGDAGDAPLERLAGEGVDVDDRRRARRRRAAGRARRGWRRAARCGCRPPRRPATFDDTKAPGSRFRLPTNPSTGDRMRRVRQRDAELLEARLGLLELRAREVELRDGGLLPRLGVVERLLREQLAVEEVRDRARLVSANFRSASRCRMVAWPTSNDASACFTCSRISRSSTRAMQLAARDAVADAHGDVLQPAAHLRHDLDRLRRQPGCRPR